MNFLNCYRSIYAKHSILVLVLLPFLWWIEINAAKKKTVDCRVERTLQTDIQYRHTANLNGFTFGAQTSILFHLYMCIFHSLHDKIMSQRFGISPECHPNAGNHFKLTIELTSDGTSFFSSTSTQSYEYCIQSNQNRNQESRITGTHIIERLVCYERCHNFCHNKTTKKINACFFPILFLQTIGITERITSYYTHLNSLKYMH